MTAHGINADLSDFRIHVCPISTKMYLFPTSKGREAADRCGAEHFGETSRGKKVPVQNIEWVRWIAVDRSDWAAADIRETDREDIRGKKAEVLVLKYLREGRIGVPLNSYVVSDVSNQFRGVDIKTEAAEFTIQVKCDYRGGIGNGATGNLYIETHERNPRRLH